MRKINWKLLIVVMVVFCFLITFQGCKKEESLVFDSMNDLEENYLSVEVFEIEDAYYAFCELKEDQIVEGESGSLVMEVIESDSKFLLEPVDEAIMPKLIEEYIKSKFTSAD